MKSNFKQFFLRTEVVRKRGLIWPAYRYLHTIRTVRFLWRFVDSQKVFYEMNLI